MAKVGWLKKIGKLKRLISEVGELWNGGTKLAGYDTKGPYHCKDCRHLKGRIAGEVFTDAEGMGRCDQPVMLADPEVEKDSSGRAIVNIPNGCCEWVDNRGLVEIEKE